MLRSNSLTFALPILVLTGFCAVAAADVIRLDSGAGLTTNTPFNTVAVTPDPLWQSDNPVNPGDATDSSAVWISYMDSGYGGTEFQHWQGNAPVVTVYDNFVSGDGDLILNVWADDTADVLLDGTYLAHAVFTQGICSGQAIGCLPQDDGAIDVPISAGQHSLSFVLYQVGTGQDTIDNPFGLLFTGTAPAAPTFSTLITTVPEPTSWLLLASVLALFSGAAFRNMRKAHLRGSIPSQA